MFPRSLHRDVIHFAGRIGSDARKSVRRVSLCSDSFFSFFPSSLSKPSRSCGLRIFRVDLLADFFVGHMQLDGKINIVPPRGSYKRDKTDG